MRKIAFVFPGQGSQYVGMGEEIFNAFPEARAVFEEADRILGNSLSELCFRGPEESLKNTRNSQPAIMTTSVAILRVLTAAGIKPDFVAGHSLGEYSALVAADVLPFESALQLIQKRAILMAEADPDEQGTMAAILGMDRASLNECLEEGSRIGTVEAANYNCPGQIVISGNKDAVARVKELVAERGGKFIPLAVSGAFHSSFMKDAAEKLQPSLQNTKWQDPVVPLISNVTARPVNAAAMASDLYQQIFSSVLWEDTLVYMAGQQVDTFIEIGPGKVLSGLVKKTVKTPGVTILNCDDPASIKKALEILKEV